MRQAIKVAILPFLLLLLAATAPGVLASPSSAYIQATYDTPNENYIKGYVTWKDGKHGLAWEEGFASDAGGGPATVAGAQPQQFRFESQPFPRDAWMNVTRLIHAEFYTKSGTGPEAGLVIRIDGKIFGGTAHDTSGWEPDYMAGYSVATYRFQSEFAFVKKGSILQFEYTASQAAQFATGGQRPSILWLPIYAPYEVALRRPYMGPADAPGGNGPAPTQGEARANQALAVPWPLLGLAAPLLLRRRAAPLFLLILLSSAMAGCSGKAAPKDESAPESSPTGGRVDETIGGDADNHTGLADAKRGGIAGTVADVDGFPVAKAHVLLMGTSNFTTTNPGGSFTFAGLAPRTYLMRVAKDGFHVLEHEVTVKASAVTRLEIVLESTTAQGEGGFRRHPHDNWEGKDEILLHERDVYFQSAVITSTDAGTPTGAMCPFIPAFASGFCSEMFKIPSPDPTKPLLITPGTVDVEVVATYDASAPGTPPVGVGFIANNQRGNNANWTMMYPRGSDVATHIRTNQEMMDSGHQHYSTWQFQVFVPAGSYVLRNPVHVAITIHRGFIPLEPAHMDYWGPNLTLPVLDKAPYTFSHNKYGGYSFPYFPYKGNGWQPAPVVPSETKWLEITMKQDKAGTPAYDWGLIYKTATTGGDDPYYDFSDYRPLVPKATQGLTKEYVLVLADGEADPFYARSTQWWFLLDDKVESHNVGGQHVDAYAIFYEPITWELTVIAHKDDPPTG